MMLIELWAQWYPRETPLTPEEIKSVHSLAPIRGIQKLFKERIAARTLANTGATNHPNLDEIRAVGKGKQHVNHQIEILKFKEQNHGKATNNLSIQPESKVATGCETNNGFAQKRIQHRARRKNKNRKRSK